MISTETLQLAKQGDIESIELLLNKKLEKQKINATVNLNDSCLAILFVYDHSISSTSLVKYTEKIISKLDIQNIDTVKVQAKRPDAPKLIWQKIFYLKKESEQLNSASKRKDFPASSNIEADIHGNVSGQVAIGSYILQIGEMHGGVVSLAQETDSEKPLRRPLPIFLKPRPFPNLIGRQTEVRAAIGAIQHGQPIEFYGPTGIGKTTLLRHLVYHPKIEEMTSDGMVYLVANSQGYGDLLQALYDTFYESRRSFKPTENQIFQSLQGCRSLVFVDDVFLSREELQILLNSAPNCMFVITATTRKLWGEGHSLGIPKLSRQEAVALVENNLGRPLKYKERKPAMELVSLLEGNPLRVLQAMSSVSGADSLAAILNQVSSEQSDNTLLLNRCDGLLERLSEDERKILDILMILGGVPIKGESIAELSKINAISILESFVRNGVIQSDGELYTISLKAERLLQSHWEPKACLQWLLPSVQNWLVQKVYQPEQLVQESRILRRILKVAFRWGSWTNVIWISLHVEKALAKTGYWDAWQETLEWALRSSQKLNDLASEAYVHHQIGIRALCLEQTVIAKEHLQEATQIRSAIGDEIGSEISKQALDMAAATTSQTSSNPVEGIANTGSTLGLLKGTAALVVSAAAVTGVIVSDVKLPFSEALVFHKTENTDMNLAASSEEQSDSTPENVKPTSEPVANYAIQEDVAQTDIGGDPKINRADSSDKSKATEPSHSCLVGMWQENQNSLQQVMNNLFRMSAYSDIRYSDISGYVTVDFQQDKYLLTYHNVSLYFQPPQTSASYQAPEDMSVSFQGQVSAIYELDVSKRVITFSSPNMSLDITNKTSSENSIDSGSERVLADDLESLYESIDGINISEISDSNQLTKELQKIIENFEKPTQVSYDCVQNRLTMTEQVRINGTNIEFERQFTRTSNQ